MTKSNQQSITIHDVARRANLSVATVSRHLNKTGLVSPLAALAIDQAIADLHYVPHAAARNLATQKTHAIGLLLSDMQGDFFAPLLSGVEDGCKRKDYDLLIATSQSGTPRKNRPLPLGPHNCDGMLVFAENPDMGKLLELNEQAFPMVFIHQTPPPELKIPYVTVENKAASSQLVSHLITVHGRRKIVFLSGPDGQEDSHWRELGYRAALAAHGIPLDARLVSRGDFDRHVAESSIHRLLEAGVEFDAVFTGDDEAAVGVLVALRAAGKQVPDEVSVVGFDDQRLAPYLAPPLTTVRAPTEEVGRTAVRQLLKVIQNQKVEATVLLPTEIQYRQSCGCK